MCVLSLTRLPFNNSSYWGDDTPRYCVAPYCAVSLRRCICALHRPPSSSVPALGLFSFSFPFGGWYLIQGAMNTRSVCVRYRKQWSFFTHAHGTCIPETMLGLLNPGGVPNSRRTVTQSRSTPPSPCLNSRSSEIKSCCCFSLHSRCGMDGGPSGYPAI